MMSSIDKRQNMDIKHKVLNMEEERVNAIAFLFGVFVSVGAFIVVVGFLGGGVRDSIVLMILIKDILIRFLEKRVRRFQKYAKYAYMTLPFSATCVLIVSNDGKFAAVTQFYIMWLMLSVAYCDVALVLFCAAVTVVSTVGALIFFPEAMLLLDNLTIWFYIFTIYSMATLLAAIIAWRMRNLIQQARQAKMYETELVYLEQLQKKEEQHSEFIHNINHYFKAIGELAREEHCGQIMDLVEELNLNLMQNERIIYTSHRMVNAVLSGKAQEAAELGVRFDVYVEPNVHFGETAQSDLAAILGNLLDNALEATVDCRGEKRTITLKIFMENEGSVCVIKLMNYFVKKPVRYKAGFISTKKGHGQHGIGIRSVENTAKKYGGYLQCIVEEERFIAILILPVRNLQKLP